MTRTLRSFTSVAFGMLFLAAPQIARAQHPLPSDAGCVEHKGAYTCNWSSFKLIFERAHSVAPQAAQMDRPAARQLKTLITELGKTPVGDGQPADLTFAVSPVDPHGLDFGPMDHDLATLKIYAPDANSPRGNLVWAEVYRGQGDRPWPAQVHALLEQFQARLHPR